MNLAELGQRVRELREKRWLKQRDIANALQISPQAVSKWERGENAPDLAVLLDLSKLLGVSCDTLLGRREKTGDTFEATVFCTGLNHFAERSAQMPPRDVALWANGLFHLVTEAVVRWDGVPVKYVGDGFLGFFSGAGHARRAVRAGLETQRLVASEDMVIALHTGEIYLGSIGHAEYARPDIIGDAVNTGFLVMHWLSGRHPGGLGLTETVRQRLDGEWAFTPGERAYLKPSRRRVMVYGVQARMGPGIHSKRR